MTAYTGSEEFDNEVELNDEGELKHYGTARKSGRYPWGSGDTPSQRNRKLLDHVAKLHKDGLSEAEIAKGMDMSTTRLRALKQIANTEQKQAMIGKITQMREDRQMSNVAIGEALGINESQVRALMNPATKERNDILETTAEMLRQQVADKKYLDVGLGVEQNLGVSSTKLATAVQMLREEGYTHHSIHVPQVGTNSGQKTKFKVLAEPGVEWKEVLDNKDQIRPAGAYSEDHGRTFEMIKPPVPVNPKRVQVRYAEDGGSDMDGVIQLRRGVDDISMGDKRYAQVRIQVGDGHYLKGMAMYADDLPPGVDMRFNTNKSKKPGGTDLDAMKGLKDDPENPFGSITKQRHYTDAQGNKKQSVLNIVGDNEEGRWSEWSKNLSSQMMSKQTPQLAKEQLGLKHDLKKLELDEINTVTNPAVKRKLLEAYADGADSAAVTLKAAGLPRTANHVILPINSLKDNEIFAPNYQNGERVSLVRHPHGGTFEIPELIVNNKNREANAVIKQARDAVGINSKVAARLSGADFDGDTVLVIPNNKGKVTSTPPLVKDFDPQRDYKAYNGMKTIDGGTWDAQKGKAVYPEGKQPSGRQKQLKMGDVSNLITDMTIMGAPRSELAKAVKHSMVVIDAEKHSLNWKQSAIDNDINALKKKYQGASNAGAKTIISQASSDKKVSRRKLRPASEGGPVDKQTGKLVWVDDPDVYVNKQGQTVERFVKVPKMMLTDDANTLTSGGGYVMEKVYADHANKMKALANQARKEREATKPIPYSQDARKQYSKEVDTLKAKLNIAKKHKPNERQAQLLAGAMVKAKVDASPTLDQADLKKIKGRALEVARRRTGGSRPLIDITPIEWEAIQKGAISNNFLEEILSNANLDQVRVLATPRDAPKVKPAQLNRARSMFNSGYTQAEIATALGISATTIMDALGSEGSE